MYLKSLERGLKYQISFPACLKPRRIDGTSTTGSVKCTTLKYDPLGKRVITKSANFILPILGCPKVYNYISPRKPEWSLISMPASVAKAPPIECPVIRIFFG